MKKKLMALFLSVALLVTMLPAGMASAAYFTDVAAGDWFVDEVNYVSSYGLMQGTGNGKFSPEAKTTKGMAVLILWRMAGCPVGYGRTSYADVTAGEFASAIDWAVCANLITPVNAAKFGQNDPITREDLALLYFNYIQYMDYDVWGGANISSFADSTKVSGKAYAAMCWAVGTGIIRGKVGVLDPQGTTTRAELAAIVGRFHALKEGGLFGDGTHTVTYYVNDNTDTIYYAESVVPGEGIGVPAVPYREGYDFLGWFTDSGCRMRYNFGHPVYEDLSLYAGWAERHVAPPTSSGPSTITVHITNDGYDASTSAFATQTESVALTGMVSGGKAVKYLVSYVNYQNSGGYMELPGTESFSAQIPLSIGTNTVSVTAVDENGATVTKDVYINRTSTEVKFAETLKLADAEDFSRLDSDFIACWVDDNGTEAENDDTIVILTKDDGLLLGQINAGLLTQGETYMIPQNDYFVTGFTGVYECHRAPRGLNENYPLALYPDAGYEELIFSYPNFGDLFSGDVSLDFSQGFNTEDPIAFVLSPDGTPVTPAEVSVEDSPSPMRFAMRREADKKYPRKGWQPQELAKNALPTLKVTFDRYDRANIDLEWDDTVIYDRDGVDTAGIDDPDSMRIAGQFGVNNLKYTSGMEWHPNFIPWEFDILPQQIINKLEYDFGGEITVKGGLSVNTSGLVKALNDGFDNKNEFWGMSVSGVDNLKSKWVIGVVGLNLIPPSATTGTSIKDQAVKSTLSPSLVLVLFIDMDGNLTVEGSMTFGYETNVVKGYNIQKNGYTGSYGSQNQNRSDKHYNIGFDRTLDVYDENDGHFKLSFGGKVEATADVGLGVGAGLMISSVIPAMMDGEIFYRASGLVEGEIQFLPNFDLNGYAGIYHGIGAQSDLAAKLFIETKIGDAGFDVKKHFEHMFWEQTKSTSFLNGKVFVADDDGDNTNNAVIAGADVKLKKNDTGKIWTTTTDNNGFYTFNSIPDGPYTLTVSKDGYDTYTNSNLIFSKKLEDNHIYLNETADLDGQCSLSGKITIADEDTDQTNNLPLAGCQVYIRRNDGAYTASATTDANGNYKLTELPAGNYSITISKTGYITVYAQVAIADNIQNYYNAMVEAISEEYQGVGGASGNIYDAVTGDKVAGLTLRVRGGINNSIDTVIATTKTNANGKYSFDNLPAGNYTVEIVDERTLSAGENRYSTSYFTIKVLGGKDIGDQHGHVTNLLSSDQLRIVLKWGQRPYDLDSHLVGPTSNGGEFHVYYSDKTHYENGTRMADLDLDDTSSYGPETTTIYNPVSGEYVYLIHDYTNRRSESSMEMANSGAYVEVYLGNSTVAAYTFHVPVEDGTLWTVFSFNPDTGDITPINTMSYEDYSGDVGVTNSVSAYALRRYEPEKETN